MIAPARPTELTPGAGTGLGPVVATATDVWVTGAVVGFLERGVLRGDLSADIVQHLL